MKYQSQHDLIDPEAPAPEPDFESEGHDVSKISYDDYVIGEHGEVVREHSVKAVARSRQGTKAWAKPAAFALVVLFVVLTVWNTIRFVQGPPPPPKPSPFQAKQALYLGVMRIDAYRKVHGVVPETLVDAGLPEADAYAYQRLDPTHYRLSFRGGGSKLEYDSSEPKESFFGSPRELLTMGDSK